MALEELAAAPGEAASLGSVTLPEVQLFHRGRVTVSSASTSSWQDGAISPSCPPRNSHAGHCQCTFLTVVCQLLEGEMNKQAMEGEEY